MLLGSALLQAQTISARGASEAEPKSVCDLFVNLRSHVGTLIVVRGEVRTNRHGWALAQQGCRSGFLAEGIEWPAVFDLEPGNTAVPPPSFETDSRSIAKMDKILSFLNTTTAHELGVEITATFVGEIRIKNRYLVNGNGRGLGGYGPFGEYPAQLVYKSVRDIVVRQLGVTNYFPSQN